MDKENHEKYCSTQWRTEGGGLGVQTLPEIPKFRQSRTGLQIERKMFSVPIPTSQDVRKKGSKIPKLPRFAIVLHLQ